MERRRGMTLVELLAVMAIIGLLVALLLPAVQSARESARRTACGNNLKQVGTALHAHQASHGVFPPAGRGYGWCTLPNGEGDSHIYNSNGLVTLLPYLDLASLYDSFNHEQAFAGHSTTGGCVSQNNTTGTTVGNPQTNGNGVLAGTLLSIFLCPSDIRPSGSLERGSIYSSCDRPGKATNYDFVVGDRNKLVPCNWWRVSATTSGWTTTQRMFGENSTTTPAHVRDGLGNTFAIGETTLQYTNGGGLAWAYRAHVQNGINPGGSEPGINLWWTAGRPQCVPKAGVACTWWANAASNHPGGCSFAMGDGAVRFVSDQTGATVLENLSSMRDGQAVSIGD
jgi:prepilin-type N-terminal cleavage/methylation domain-containing protein